MEDQIENNVPDSCDEGCHVKGMSGKTRASNLKTESLDRGRKKPEGRMNGEMERELGSRGGGKGGCESKAIVHNESGS